MYASTFKKQTNGSRSQILVSAIFLVCSKFCWNSSSSPEKFPLCMNSQKSNFMAWNESLLGQPKQQANLGQGQAVAKPKPMPQYSNVHRLRTHDGYFPNSFRPISYLEYVWVWSEKQSYFWKKQLNDGNHGQGTHNAKPGANNSAINTPKFIRPICPIGIMLKKASLGVRSPW